ncbi:hypothetical protein EJB05_49532, partial [Eragrostis curvula]
MMAEPGVSDWRISTRRGVRHSCPRPEIRAAAPRGTAWIHCRVQAHHYDLQPTAAARTKLVKKSEDKAVNRRGTSGFSQSWTSTLQSSKVTSEADIVSNVATGHKVNRRYKYLCGGGSGCPQLQNRICSYGSSAAGGRVRPYKPF